MWHPSIGKMGAAFAAALAVMFSAAVAGSATAAPAAPFDFADAGTWKTMDWSSITVSPGWRAVPAVGAGNEDQRVPEYPYIADRKGMVVIAGRQAVVTMEIPRGDTPPEERRIVIGIDEAKAEDCGLLREWLTRAYGRPTAVGSNVIHNGRMNFDIVSDDLQWRVGNTAISLGCTNLGDGQLVLVYVDLEPASVATPVSQPVRAACKAATGPALELILDERSSSIMDGNGDILTWGRYAPDSVRYRTEEGDVVTIDRRTGDFTRAASSGATVSGHCRLEPLPRPVRGQQAD
jgi:hypothetical protein